MFDHRQALAAGELVAVGRARLGLTRTPLLPGFKDAPNSFLYPGNMWTYSAPMDILYFTLSLDIHAIPAGTLALTIDGDLGGTDYSISSGTWHPVDVILGYEDLAGQWIDDRHIVMVIEKQSIQWTETGPVTTLTGASIEILSQDNLALNVTGGGALVTWQYDGHLTHYWHLVARGFDSRIWSVTDDVLPILSQTGPAIRNYEMPDEAFNVLDLALMAAQDLGYTTFPNLDPDRMATWTSPTGMRFRRRTIAALDLVQFENTTIPAWDLAGLILPGAALDLTPEDWANELFVTQTWDTTEGRQEKRTRYSATGLGPGAISKSTTYAEDTRPSPRDAARFQAMVNRWAERPMLFTCDMVPDYWLTPGDPITCPAGTGHIRSLVFTPTRTSMSAVMRRRFRGWTGGPHWAEATGTWSAQTLTWKDTADA